VIEDQTVEDVPAVEEHHEVENQVEETEVEENNEE
jgi:hypothetical protein